MDTLQALRPRIADITLRPRVPNIALRPRIADITLRPRVPDITLRPDCTRRARGSNHTVNALQPLHPRGAG